MTQPGYCQSRFRTVGMALLDGDFEGQQIGFAQGLFR
jgi:hypothetical protein